MKDLQSLLDRTLFQKAILLRRFGSSECAWERLHALEVVDYCLGQSLAVLGGDVITISNERVVYTLDNWFYDDASEGAGEDSWQTIVDRSCELAKSKIMFFSDNFAAKSIFFILVVTDSRGFEWLSRLE